MAIKLHSSVYQHPGPWLRREVLEPYRLNIAKASRHLRVTRPTLSNLINGKAALTPEMAIRFEKAFGISAATLLRMQAGYDLAQAEARADDIDVDRIGEPA